MREIVVINTPPADDGLITFRLVFWFPVNPTKAVPLVGSVRSAAPNPTQDEVTALTSGTLLEEVREFTFPVSWMATNLPVIMQLLQQAWIDRNTYIQNLPSQIQYSGVGFDGATWK